MIALIFTPLYIFLNYLLLKRLLKKLVSINIFFSNKIIKSIIIILFILFSISPLISFLLINKGIRIFSYYYIVSALYFLLILLIIYFLEKLSTKIKFLSRYIGKNNNILNIIIIFVLAVFLIYGSYNANNIEITNYKIDINNKQTNLKKLKIALIADLHLGYNNGYKQVDKIINKINLENPDIVLIAGDIFDNEISSLDDTKKIVSSFKKIKSKYGAYAVYGNHDVDEKILLGFTFKSGGKKSNIEMDDLLKKSNIELLEDESKLIDNDFYLIGRVDFQKPNKKDRKSINELLKNIDKTKPIIIIDHQPREFDKLENKNIDLVLSGHTHNGQIFPGNIVTSLMYKNSYGYKKINEINSVVTSGVGVFGPKLRMGTKSEVVIVDVKFNK